MDRRDVFPAFTCFSCHCIASDGRTIQSPKLARRYILDFIELQSQGLAKPTIRPVVDALRKSEGGFGSGPSNALPVHPLQPPGAL
jgi:hypothetical protein